MGFDRNTVIGFVLLGGLLFIYLFTSTRSRQEIERQRTQVEDSIAKVKAHQQALAKLNDTVHEKKPVIDTTVGFNRAVAGTEHLLTVENDLLKIVFSNHGGQPVEVQLKQFPSYDSTPVKLVEPGSGNLLSYPINTGVNQTAEISDLYFDAGQVVRNADGSQTVSFHLPAPAGESLNHEFTVHPGSYLIDWNVNMTNPGALLTQNNLNLVWHDHVKRAQPHIQDDRRYANIGFSEGNEFDYMSRGTDKTFEKPVQWVSCVQQFFNTTLIAKQSFNSGTIAAHWVRSNDDTTNTIARVDVSLQAKAGPGSAAALGFQLYYGPNDYSTLKKLGQGLDKNVDLGRGMYSFVRPLNVYIIMPVFDFIKKFVNSYGLAIMLLTIFIRLVTSPLVYTSYMSGAKMKALRPEIEAMKKRVGDDKQAQGMEQMKLFREAGVNPLGGCIPALLQIPIFFALYSSFSSNVALRGEHFLWSKDLSTYDSVLHFGFNIPAYGDHVSLFALTAVATSFLITLYGMSMTPDQSNPMMKYMPYIMPVMLLLFFNSLSSALTWYYTVSNAITLLIQFVIQHYIIDHDKILAKLKENRAKPKVKSKWQERLEQMQEQQRKTQQQRKS